MKREEAIKLIDTHTVCFYNEIDSPTLQALHMAISALSAEAVQGEWIESEDWNGDNYYDCSVCGESFVLCDGTPSMNLYHFCPNCGARMKGGNE